MKHLLLFLAFACLIYNVCAYVPSVQEPEGNSNPGKFGINEIDSINNLIISKWQHAEIDSNTISLAHIVADNARKINYEKGLALSLLNLVRCYVFRYESARSLEYALEAQGMFEKLNDKDNYAYTTMQLGIIYYTLQNYYKSLSYYKDAIKNYEELNDQNKISTLFYLSAIDYSLLKEYDKAAFNFKNALALKIQTDDKKGIAECRMGIAELFIQQQNPDSALFYIEPVYEYTSEANNKYGLSKANIVKAQAMLMKNEIDNAIYFAENGNEIALTMNAKELRRDAYKVLFLAMEKQGDYKKAFDYINQYNVLKDTLNNEKISQNIAQLESDYMLEKKQNEIRSLEKESNQRKFLFRISVGVILIVLLLLGFAFRSYHLKQKINKKLSTAYEELRNTQQKLVHNEKMASLGHLTAGIAHEIKNPLNFVNNFSAFSVELISDLKNATSDQEKKEILQDLESNIEKINHHGKRADSIVSKMLLHSRNVPGEKTLNDINALCISYHNLAYQGFSMTNPGFNCKLETTLDSNIPEIPVEGHEVGRVFLNLFNNAFFSLNKKLKSGIEFTPTLKVITSMQDNTVQIRIRDNGEGIPEIIRNQVFEPFFTTKPPGEGTGLGLSMSYDIIQAHGGELSLEPVSGEFTTFSIKLPFT